MKLNSFCKTIEALPDAYCFCVILIKRMSNENKWVYFLLLLLLLEYATVMKLCIFKGSVSYFTLNSIVISILNYTKLNLKFNVIILLKIIKIKTSTWKLVK